MTENPSQDTAKQIQDAQKRIKDLNDEIKRLGGEGFSNINQLVATFNNDLTGANRQIRLMQDEVDDLKNAFSNISDTLKNVVADINGSTKASTLLTRNFNKLEDYSRKISDHRKGDNVLSVKELKTIEKKVAKEMESLKANLEEAKAQATILERKQLTEGLTKSEQEELKKNKEYQSEISQALNDQKSYLNQIVPLTIAERKEEEKIQKTLGLTGMAFKGISGALEKIGIQSKYFEGMEEKLREAAKSGKQLNVFTTGLKGVFSGIGEALKDPVGKFLLLLTLAKKLVDFGLHFNKQTAELGKQYGLSREAAQGLLHSIEKSSVASNDLYMNSHNMVEAMGQVNEALGTSAILSDDLVKGQIDLTKKLGMSGEEAAGLTKYSILTGKSQEDIVKQITKANKGLISNKAVLKEVAKTEGQLAAFYKNDPVLIGAAITQAQKLGLTLQQTKNITDGLLDVESSLQSEFEAEVLTGKQINLDRARSLALQGKTAEAAAEMLKNVGGIAEFQKMNRIQQDALAKSMGMSSDELAKTLTQQAALGKLSDAQRKKVAELRAAGKDELADLYEKNAGNDKGLAMAEIQVDTQEKLAQAAQKFQDIIASLVAGPIGTLLDGLSSGLSVINQIFKALSVLKVPLMIIGGIFGTIWTAAKGIQLAETITGALQGKKLKLLVTENLLKIKGDAMAAVDLAREGKKISFKQLNSALEKESFLVKTQAYAVALKEWAVERWKSLTKKEQLVTDQAQLLTEQSTLATQESQVVVEQKSLLTKIKESLIVAKDFVIEKASLLVQYASNAAERISLALKQKGILLTIKDFFKSMAQAAMKAYSSAAAIPFVGWALGIAAAAAVVGLGMKLIGTGDDVVSPGYGKRTLMAPEGAIALNDKDTVIAGTNLGGKGKEKDEIKGGGPSIDLSPLIAAVNEVTAAVNGLMERPTSVYLDGVQLAQKLQTPMAVTARKTG